MPSLSAKRRTPPTRNKSVVFVVYPDVTLLDLAGPLQVFSCATHSGTTRRAYDTSIVSLDGEKTKTDTVVSLDTDAISTCRKRSIDTLVVVGGDGALAASQDARFIKQVQNLMQRSKRVCSVCSGAFVLAATGILDHRRAVTHWSDCDTLATHWPRVKVEVDPIFVKEGHVWTSAGITAGIDLALAIVAEDMGQKCALDVARTLVTYVVRPGGQSQFSPALHRQNNDLEKRFDDLHEWIGQNLHSDLRVEVLAERVNMSARNFSRIYSKQMGQPPAKAVESIRVEAARSLLETTSSNIASVASRCGFMDDERMRRAFVRTLGVSPSDYRRRFQAESGLDG